MTYKELYLNTLGYQELPEFIKKYLICPSLTRLKKVGYFCGMDYASKDIYDFKEYISRYDHSLSTALLVYNLTKNKTATIAALLHDISTPCFSHVIDYMNQDFDKQESTEAYTGKIIMEDKYLLKALKKDNIKPKEVIDFKQYWVVDNERPKLCADRLDGIILTGIGWTKTITDKEILEILDSIIVTKNEYEEFEIGFKNIEVAQMVLNNSNLIDEYCHTNEDNYMMILLADIVKYSIDKEYITYDDLFFLNEEELFTILNLQEDILLQNLLKKFKEIKKKDIPVTQPQNIKRRILLPLVNGNRLNNDNRL